MNHFYGRPKFDFKMTSLRIVVYELQKKENEVLLLWNSLILEGESVRFLSS